MLLIRRNFWFLYCVTLRNRSNVLLFRIPSGFFRAFCQMLKLPVWWRRLQVMVNIMVGNCDLDKSKVLLSKQELVKVEDTDSDETLPPIAITYTVRKLLRLLQKSKTVSICKWTKLKVKEHNVWCRMKRTQCFYFHKKQTLMCLYYSLSDSDEIYVNYHTTIFAIECCNPKNYL